MATRRSARLTIAGRALGTLRSTASSILAAGDTRHREQFAQMGVSFTARSAGRVATADFDIDIGAGTPYDRAWDVVFNRVYKALEDESGAAPPPPT